VRDLKEVETVKYLLRRTTEMTVRRVKVYLKCSVLTEKVDGCGHITCMIKGCCTY